MMFRRILVAGLVTIALGGARPQAARADANRDRELAKIAAEEMPQAAKRDPGLEKAIAKAYMEGYPDDKVKVLKVLILSTDWSTDRSSVGIITGRHIQAVVVTQHTGNDMAKAWGEPSGSYCELHSEAWEQEYIGKKFAAKMTPAGAGSLQKSGILCAKAGVKEGAAAAAPAQVTKPEKKPTRRGRKK